MPELKIKSNTYLGFIHFLIGGLLVPVIFGIITNPIISVAIKNNSTSMYVGFVIGLIGIWLGVLFSAKLLLKKYVLSNPVKVAGIATTYYVILSAFFSLALASVIVKVPGGSEALYQKDFVVNLVLSVIQFFVFYWISKNYLSKQQAQSAV